MDILLTPIGLIHTPFSAPAGTPIQSSRSNAEGWVEVFPEYVDMFDQTPLLDMKPYVPEFDQREGVRAGWYEHRAKP